MIMCKSIFMMLLCGMLSMCVVSPVMAETHQICGPDSGLSWVMNTETDMDKYIVYHSESEAIVPNAINVFAFEVAHSPENAVPDPDDSTQSLVISDFPNTFPDGLRYFAVSAVDKVGNESGVSNEVSCRFDKSAPVSPTIFLRF